MKVAVVSDIHDDVAHVDVVQNAMAQADALIVCGDFTTFGDAARIQAVADALDAEKKPRFFVIGNCDQMPVDGALRGWRNLHGRVVEWNGWLLAGLGGSTPCPKRTPCELSESVYGQLLDEIRRACAGREDRLILVAHQPPYDTDADRLPTGLHVGSRVLRSFLDLVQPAYYLTGHIHEGASRSQIGRTVVLNPGPLAQGHVPTIELG
jgi:Icc-related predicted phosphoesterase